MEYSKYNEIVAAAEIWRHWWLHSRAKPELTALRELLEAAEVALEHEVAKLTDNEV